MLSPRQNLRITSLTRHHAAENGFRRNGTRCTDLAPGSSRLTNNSPKMLNTSAPLAGIVLFVYVLHRVVQRSVLSSRSGFGWLRPYWRRVATIDDASPQTTDMIRRLLWRRQLPAGHESRFHRNSTITWFDKIAEYVLYYFVYLLFDVENKLVDCSHFEVWTLCEYDV